MESRLFEVLEFVIYSTKDKKLKKILNKVLNLYEEISCYDYSGWQEVKASDEYGNKLIKEFEDLC